MSELKAIRGGDIHDDVEFGYGDEDRASFLYYLKSEADKVIAEKDAEIARFKAIRKVHVEAIESMGAGLLQDEDENRHSKYKRCLAMARWCKDNADWWNYEQINRLHEQRGNAESFRFKEAHNRFCFFAKWNERWLELAEKFKPNSTAQ